MSKAETSLILASQSRYRQQMLSRLGLLFSCHSPNIDETPLPGETPDNMVFRLGMQKAQAVRAHTPGKWIIASDQSAECDGLRLSKPGNMETAMAQLTHMQGKTVTFHTSLILITPDQRCRTHIDRTHVHFRQLGQAQLLRYLELEQPLDCAGSFKSEGLGITLFERIDNQDPTALIGLPLITLANWLTDEGLLLAD